MVTLEAKPTFERLKPDKKQQFIEAAFEEFEIEEIKAITSKENISSQHLLEKLGLKMVEVITLPNDDEELLLYNLHKNIL